MRTPQHISSFLNPHGQFRAKVLLAMVRHRWFIRLRWLFVFAALALLLLEHLLNPGTARHSAVVICIVVLGLINVNWTILGRQLLREPEGASPATPTLMTRIIWFANAQMTLDILLLTVILRYSGGIENPMVVFYLFHMLIAALLLRPLNALLQGLWALMLFSGLAIGECAGWIAPHHSFLPYFAETNLHTNWVFVLIEIGVLATAVFGALYFTLQISARLDEQEHSLREANRALRESQDAIRDLQARRARFMQTAAHQLKSPLAGVQTLAGLIRDGVVKADALQPTCARIIRRCKEGISQVTELLTLARVQQAGPTRNSESVTDVGEIVRRICQEYAPQAEEKDNVLSCQVSNGVNLRALVDPVSLADCVGNLIDNAIKYTTGPGKIEVSVRRGTAATGHTEAVTLHCQSDSTAPTPDWILVAVKDNGMGIEPEAIGAVDDPSSDNGSIFDSFRRGSYALAAGIPGTGLGLAIVREIVEQANGRIFVESIPDDGSTFSVAFPGLGRSREIREEHQKHSLDGNTSH